MPKTPKLKLKTKAFIHQKDHNLKITVKKILVGGAQFRSGNTSPLLKNPSPPKRHAEP